MMELDNITLKEYFALADKSQYDLAISYATDKSPFAKASDYFNTGGLWNKAFDDIRYFQKDAAKGMTWSQLIDWIEKFSHWTTEEIGESPIVEFHQGKNYLFEELETINQVEAQMLAYTPKNEEIEAGIEEFEQFGHYGQLLNLVEGLRLTMEQAKSLPYEEAFLYLSYTSSTHKFQERLSNIRMRKQKNNLR